MDRYAWIQLLKLMLERLKFVLNTFGICVAALFCFGLISGQVKELGDVVEPILIVLCFGSEALMSGWVLYLAAVFTFFIQGRFIVKDIVERKRWPYRPTRAETRAAEKKSPIPPRRRKKKKVQRRAWYRFVSIKKQLKRLFGR